MAGETIYLTPTNDLQQEGAYSVRFVDPIDGSVIERWMDVGQIITPPAQTVHSGLTAAGWGGASGEKLTVTNNAVFTGVYNTTDGKVHIIVEASDLVGLTPTIKVNKTDTSTLTIDWGDGTTVDSTASGNVTLTKTAPYVAGTYTIKKWISSGAGNFTGGFGTTGNPMLSGVAALGAVLRSTTTTISDYAMNGTAFRTLAYAVGSGVTYIGSSAFAACYAFRDFSFPNCATVMPSAFSTCYFTKCSLPKATVLGSSAFTSCTGLEILYAPLLVTAGSSAFSSATNFLSADYPLLTTASDSSFTGCFRMPSVTWNGVTAIGASTFRTNGAMITARLYAAITVGATAFQSCRRLERVWIGANCTLIDTQCFDGCRNLRELHIAATSPPTLSNVNALTDTDPRLLIYVPAASVAAYKAATNWSTFTARIVAEP